MSMNRKGNANSEEVFFLFFVSFLVTFFIISPLWTWAWWAPWGPAAATMSSHYHYRMLGEMPRAHVGHLELRFYGMSTGEVEAQLTDIMRDINKGKTFSNKSIQ